VAVEEVPPTSVADLTRPIRGPDDVGEQHGGEDSLRTRTASDAGHELLDLVEHRPRFTYPVQDVGAGELDARGARDVLGEISTVLGAESRVVGA
jgi:hypothetical protein